jgi:hypothetical protein
VEDEERARAAAHTAAAASGQTVRPAHALKSDAT